LAMTLDDPFTGYAHDYLARNAARLGYDLRSPMYARGFIEFNFAIPQRQKLRGEVRKFVHVAAMQGFLPDNVRNRRTKAVFNRPFERLLDSATTFMLDRMLQCGIEGVDQDGLGQLIQRYEQEASGQKPIYELWAVIGCANLFRRVSGDH
jgi:hypothetical protein